MAMEKLKGFIKEETMKKLLSKSEEVERRFTDGETTYWTGKGLFVLRRKSQRYWAVYQLRGV